MYISLLYTNQQSFQNLKIEVVKTADFEYYLFPIVFVTEVTSYHWNSYYEQNILFKETKTIRSKITKLEVVKIFRYAISKFPHIQIIFISSRFSLKLVAVINVLKSTKYALIYEKSMKTIKNRFFQ